jgi:hypothetical protein
MVRKREVEEALYVSVEGRWKRRYIYPLKGGGREYIYI